MESSPSIFSTFSQPTLTSFQRSQFMGYIRNKELLSHCVELKTERHEDNFKDSKQTLKIAADSLDFC